uniref:Uncharacterized protein n=1 Tax=Arion vulgaris TaxID=1028688 RepID=A0A0B6ZJY7_9EUPU
MASQNKNYEKCDKERNVPPEEELHEPELLPFVRVPCQTYKMTLSLKPPRPKTPVPEPEMPENVCPAPFKPPCCKTE